MTITQGTAQGKREQTQHPASIGQFVGYFLWLGTVGVGGPIALAGHMQQDLVDDRHWISREDYVEDLALAQLAPGPLPAQLAIYLGYLRRGAGGDAGGSGIRPAIVFDGARPLGGLRTLWRAALDAGNVLWNWGSGDWDYRALGFQAYEEHSWQRPAVVGDLYCAGGLDRLDFARGYLVVPAGRRDRNAGEIVSREGACGERDWLGFIRSSRSIPGEQPVVGSFSVFRQGWNVCFRQRPRYHAFLIWRRSAGHHWLTDRQFVDAVAVAMITPGPVVITVAFIGYLVAGTAGAGAAALGGFLPVYLVVVALAPSYKKWAKNPQLNAFVRGVTAAAAGAIAQSSCSRGDRFMICRQR